MLLLNFIEDSSMKSLLKERAFESWNTLNNAVEQSDSLLVNDLHVNLRAFVIGGFKWLVMAGRLFEKNSTEFTNSSRHFKAAQT